MNSNIADNYLLWCNADKLIITEQNSVMQLTILKSMQMTVFATTVTAQYTKLMVMSSLYLAVKYPTADAA